MGDQENVTKTDGVGFTGSSSTENVFRTKVLEALNRELNELEKALMNQIKDKALELYNLYNAIMNPNNVREFALAKTKLEESVMWAVKGLTK